MWQYPECILENLTCTYEKSSRGRCKAIECRFAKNEVKVGTGSHIATSYYKIEAFEEIIAKVMISIAFE